MGRVRAGIGKLLLAFGGWLHVLNGATELEDISGTELALNLKP